MVTLVPFVLVVSHHARSPRIPSDPSSRQAPTVRPWLCWKYLCHANAPILKAGLNDLHQTADARREAARPIRHTPGPRTFESTGDPPDSTRRPATPLIHPPA